jgi:hypothetical protein
MCNILTLMAETFPREQLATYVSVCNIGGSGGGIISTPGAGKIIHSVGYVPLYVALGFLHLGSFGIIQNWGHARLSPGPQSASSLGVGADRIAEKLQLRAGRI